MVETNGALDNQSPIQACPGEGRGPGSFDQHAPCQHIAGLGDAAAPHADAGRMFGGHQAEIGHQLPRIGEAAKAPTSATTVTATTGATPRIHS